MRSAVLSLLAGAGMVGALAACQDPADVEAYEETEPRLWCGTLEPTEGGKLAAEMAMADITSAHDRAARGATIQVYVHVIRRGFGRANGDVPAADIEAQMRVLDAAFRPIGYHFNLAGVDRTTNPNWFELPQGTAIELQAKAALRRGTGRDLNIYIADPTHGVSGYATFPSATKTAPTKDGVVLLHSVLPHGGAAPYDLGDQAVHQVGHWLGLYHTYQADCDALNGDYVDDTPATSRPAFGCPVGRNTCGDDSGDDPVRNYMDSADDSCINSFTQGQRERIDTLFNAYRRF
jgi:hypothetical protein